MISQAELWPARAGSTMPGRHLASPPYFQQQPDVATLRATFGIYKGPTTLTRVRATELSLGDLSPQ